MLSMQKTSKYIGRFAPSPTGDLHFGSLVTAVASYLRARSEKGKWLVRIEDVDSTRIQKGSVVSILKTLEAHNLLWDDDIIYQSKRNDVYLSYLDILKSKNLIYKCVCTRSEINKFFKNPLTFEYVYPGCCRDLIICNNKKNTIRIEVKNVNKIFFIDKIQGKIEQNIKNEVGDFILWRKENFASYQLAVVIDDELQGITEVVRGSDLLLQTPRQIFLQNCFNFNTPQYFHIPIAVNELNQKLSKQTKSKPILIKNSIKNIINSLLFIGYSEIVVQKIINDTDSLRDILIMAAEFFNIEIIPKKLFITHK